MTAAAVAVGIGCVFNALTYLFWRREIRRHVKHVNEATMELRAMKQSTEENLRLMRASGAYR